MTPALLYAIVKDAALGLAAVFTALVYNGFRVGRWTSGFEVDRTRITKLEDRMNAGGKEWSRLSSEVNRLPTTLQDDFVTKDEMDLHRRQVEEDRKRIWEEFSRLWSRVDERRRPR